MNNEQVVATRVHAVWSRMTNLTQKVRVMVDALVIELPRFLGSV